MPATERTHWKDLFEEIVSTEICCSCSACIVACPHKVLELHDFDPIQINLDSPLDDCIHGQTGCSLCAMACPRLHPSIDAIETNVHGYRRDQEQPEGSYIYKVLARAADESVLAAGQDGGVVTGLIAWGLETGELDGAVVAAPSTDVAWLDEPRVVTTKQELLAAAGSRYTYCATPLALQKVAEMRLRSVAMVGVSCESTAIRQLEAAKIKRWVRPIKIVIGLMCCETFDYQSYMVSEVQDKRGIPLADIEKMNIKGKVILSLKNGDDVTIPLKESRPHANSWCHHCPDFSAEHADLSCGGLGMDGWTMVLVRSEAGQGYLERAVAAGQLELRDAGEEPRANDLLTRLAKKQRGRVRPDDPHAGAAYATTEAMDAARLDEARPA